jgi:hypothetical protein
VSTPLPESMFSAALENAILAELEHGPATFSWLAQHAEGAFPSEVRSCLEKMVSAGRAQFENGVFVAQIGDAPRVSTTDVETTRPEQDALPSPHPADFDWRFVPQTARLLARLARTAARHKPIALFGTPTVYQELAHQTVPVTLFERNPDMVRCLPRTDRATVTETDLLGLVDFPVGKYGVVVADPPWYPEYYQAFVKNAAAALATGGTLFLSILPRLTRPGAQFERRELLEVLLGLGFELCAYFPSKLRYRTPPFERLSLHVEGLDCGDWRRGDLGIFRLGEARSSDERLLPLPASEPIWDTFHLPLRTVRVRHRSSSSRGSFWSNPLGVNNGAVLPTVSRRHGIRDRIDVWSDLNEAWEVSRVDFVHVALQALAHATSQSLTRAQNAARNIGASDEDLVRLTELLKALQAPPQVSHAR